MNAGDGMGPGGRKKLQRPSWDHAPAAAVQWVRRSRRLTTAARLVTTALGIVLQRVVTAFPRVLQHPARPVVPRRGLAGDGLVRGDVIALGFVQPGGALSMRVKWAPILCVR
jgi:hypothetical protein